MQHFMLDGFHGYRSRFDHIELIQEILEEVPGKLGLEPAMPAFLLPYYNGVDPDDCGISAFLFLRGGHFTMHTFSFREVFFVDLCAESAFDDGKMRALLETAFPCETITSQCVTRTEQPVQAVLPDTESDFGPHVLLNIDEYAGPQNMDDLFALFDRLPWEIGMTPIMRPYVIKGTMSDDQPFISAMTMIAESHICLHVFPERQQARFDIFSCQFFESDPVLDSIKAELPGVVTYETLIGRGSKYRMRRTERSAEVARTQRWLTAAKAGKAPM